MEVGSKFNILLLAPGSKHGTFYQVVGDEFVIDSDSVLMLIMDMGKKIRIDFEKAIINIDNH